MKKIIKNLNILKTGSELQSTLTPFLRVFLVFFWFFLCVNISFADIKLKVSVSNPSNSEVKTFPVKTYLPKGITEQDVVDKGKFSVNYDYEKSLYYVLSNVTLNPGESQDLEIKIKDIWKISDVEIQDLKIQSRKVAELLAKTEYAQFSQSWTADIIKKLDIISIFQELKEILVKDRISGFKKNIELLAQIKKDLSVLEDLALGSRNVNLEELKALLGESDPVDLSSQELNSIKLKQSRNIKLNMEVVNTNDQSRSIQVKFYLPQEIKDEDVVNKSGLDVGYDYEKNLFFLYKEKIDFISNEKKVFNPEIKDIWVIPDEKIDILITHTNKLIGLLKETEYKNAGNFLGNKTISILNQIKEKQISPVNNVEQHIGEYRDNISKLEEVSKEVAKLEKLAIEAGGSAKSIAELKHIQAKEANNSLGEGLEAQKNKLQMAGRLIFKGKAPDFQTVWRVIYSILIFLGLVTLLFIALQLKQRRTIAFDNLTGLFQRAYFVQRLKDELIICQKSKRPCGVILMDIDKFKKYNDTYGHDVGDKVIKEFSLAIKESVRLNDWVGRYGGDEFVAFFSFTNRGAAVVIAEKIRRTVANWEVKVGDKVLRISTSIGVAMYPEDGLNVENLIKKADQAMYEVKKKGGNGVYMFEK